MKILYLALLCLGGISCSAFRSHGHWQASQAVADTRPIDEHHRRSKSLQRPATKCAAVAAAGRDAVVPFLPEEDVSFLWKKFTPTITLGATGFQPSHASLLNEFVKAHGCIKVTQAYYHTTMEAPPTLKDTKSLCVCVCFAAQVLNRQARLRRHPGRHLLE